LISRNNWSGLAALMVRNRGFCPLPTVKASFQEFPLSSMAR
jgi:hypothetical protein